MARRRNAALAVLLGSLPALAQPPTATPAAALAFFGFDAKLPLADYCVLGGCTNMTNVQGVASTWSGGNPSTGSSFSTSGWTTGPGALGLTGPGGTLAVSGNGNVWCFPTTNYSNVQCRFDSIGSNTGPGQMTFVGFSAAATGNVLDTDYATVTSTLTSSTSWATSPTLPLPASANNQPKACCAVFAKAGTTQISGTSPVANGGTYRMDNVWAWGTLTAGVVTPSATTSVTTSVTASRSASATVSPTGSRTQSVTASASPAATATTSTRYSRLCPV
jgi:hypothetical protein